ncbi:MAG: cysteine desulfurase family protein [bacterium]|nr:cysteine desulfurase family protein [bacterium]
MIYLDYSATTPVNDEVLDTFCKVSRNFVGNPNSLHKLGVEAKELIDASTRQIEDILKLHDKEVIYTSGASEANNTAIMGVVKKYPNRGHHIITTRLEHSSIIAPISALQNEGYEVSFVDLDENGLVTIENLKKLIRDDTVLVSIGCVNSELGIIQDIDRLGKFLKKYPKLIFHSDITQAIGKIKLNLDNVDLASFSAQKFYGLKGVGCLIKNKNIKIEPLIYGGKSTTVYRSGTPAVALIASLAKALRLVYEDFDNRYNYVKNLNSYLREELSKIDGVHINSSLESSPYILNISIKNIKSEVMLHALESEDIYISTQTACSKGGSSIGVFEITKNEDYALHSLRISLSYLTTKEELNVFLKVFKEKMRKLDLFNESN